MNNEVFGSTQTYYSKGYRAYLYEPFKLSSRNYTPLYLFSIELTEWEIK